MFGFFKIHKKVDVNKIKSFDLAVKVIKDFIQLSDWVNAVKALDEISIKEKTSFDNLIETLNSDTIKRQNQKDKIIRKEQKLFQKRVKIIQNLKTRLERKKEVYLKNIEKNRFNIRFKKIESEVDLLSGQRRTLEALDLLKRFLSENVDKDVATIFFNKEKKKIERIYEKQKRYEEWKIRNNARYEALTLIWETNKENNNPKTKKEKVPFFQRIRDRINNFKSLRQSRKNKKLLDKINLILEEDDKIKREIAERKLSNVHNWLVKEISFREMIGYEIYGKILWANKISGDTFWLEETKEKYTFFIWDATWHWVKAWFIITLLSQLFNLNYTEPFKNLVFEINNQLKQNLQSRNFITWIFFNIDKKTNSLQYIWMGHEPMLVYRGKTQTVEKIVPWGLAMWIVRMGDESLVKVKNLELDDSDVLMCYSDGLIEAKNVKWEYYWIKQLQETFKFIADKEKNINNIYNSLMDSVQLYRWWNQFDDDLTIIILKRNEENDITKRWDEYLKKLQIQEGLSSSDLSVLEWKTKKEALEKAEEIRRKKDIKLIISNLKALYYNWEMLRLKEEAIRYIKEWFADKKINLYLKKAMENENKYKISQKEHKMQAKYNVLQELYKKWDYNTIIGELEDIISKDWNI